MEFLGRAHPKFLTVHPGDSGQLALPFSHNLLILHAKSATFDMVVTIGIFNPLRKK
jgi:hypothetical protein